MPHAQLMHERIGYPLVRLTSVAWSATGRRLLAEFGGQDVRRRAGWRPALQGPRLDDARLWGAKSCSHRVIGAICKLSRVPAPLRE
jgi:hypothetical protein